MKIPKTKSSNSLTFPEKVLIIFASCSASLLASLLLLTTLLFILKISIGVYTFPLALLFTIIFSIFLSRKIGADIYELTIGLFLVAVFLLVSIIISILVYDLSYDGQAYHQEAIILLDHGWNPFYMRLTNEATANLERWLNHYPKGNWIIAASIYKLTRNIESGKFLSIFSGFVAYAFVLFGLYSYKVSLKLKILVTTLFVFNPVFIYQTLSYYIDGIVVTLLLALGFICLRIVNRKEKFLYWSLFFLSIVVINIKLASILFFVVLALIYFLYLWMEERLRFSLSFGKAVLASLIIGVFVVGFNPFVTNYSTRGHPLYPAMGKDAYDFVETNVPENYWPYLPPVRLVASVFSKSSLARGEGQYAELKMPFRIYQEELESFRQTNTKLGGFGPLFAMVFTLSILGFVYLLFTDIPTKKKMYYSMLLASIFFAAAIIPTSSVARYVPFFWWIPVLVAFLLYLNKDTNGKIAATIIAAILVINNLIISYEYFPYNINESRKLGSQLQELSQNNQPRLVHVGQFGSTKIKLSKNNIPFTEVMNIEDCINRKRFLVGNISVICESIKESP